MTMKTRTKFKKGDRVKLVASARQMIRDVGIPYVPVALNTKGRVIKIYPDLRTSVSVQFRSHPDAYFSCCPEWLV